MTKRIDTFVGYIIVNRSDEIASDGSKVGYTTALLPKQRQYGSGYRTAVSFNPMGQYCLAFGQAKPAIWKTEEAAERNRQKHLTAVRAYGSHAIGGISDPVVRELHMSHSEILTEIRHVLTQDDEALRAVIALLNEQGNHK